MRLKIIGLMSLVLGASLLVAYVADRTKMPFWNRDITMVILFMFLVLGALAVPTASRSKREGRRR